MRLIQWVLGSNIEFHDWKLKLNAAPWMPLDGINLISWPKPSKRNFCNKFHLSPEEFHKIDYQDDLKENFNGIIKFDWYVCKF